MNNFDRVSVLAEALPYIRQLRGKTVVVKYGGNAMESPELKRAVIEDVVLLSLVGVRVVVVHGGGPEINAALKAMGIESKTIGGLRYTDQATMDVVQMVLSGKVGKELVSLVTGAGGKAIGLSGLDGALFRAEKLKSEFDLGLVGSISKVSPAAVDMALDNGFIPIVSTVAQGTDGPACYNVNADTAAAELAVAMGAEKFVLLTDVRGLCRDSKDESTLMPVVELSEVPSLIRSGIVSGGMIPKLECCVSAVRRGVHRVHIIDGRIPHSLLIEMLTDSGIGTMITT